uniref:DUF547 domain-containing protein n=1 Tax=Branchiostoma floridae TaxID=7739 RepID=C3XZA3_BRAFL|eukprot:XP_002610657.1 hypothetical protein BRAFLDRAFT_65848 [Branchiostoma floridae]
MEAAKNGDGKQSSHPFGREEAVAVSQLFVCFCNNVYLGQWELARACVEQLHRCREKTPCDIQDILKAIAQHPYELRSGGVSVPTPHHLSWMCLTEFQGLQTQEVYRFHCCAITKRDSSREHQLATLTGLSTEALSFLKAVLQETPTLGHAILAHLTVSEDREMYLQHNQVLQKLYIDCVFEDLETLNNLKENGDHTERSCDICRHLYDILALLNPSRDMVDLKLQDLFSELLSFVNRDQPCLQLSAINSCLLGRPDSWLLEELAAVENEMRIRTSRQRYAERVMSGSEESSKDETSDQVITMAMTNGEDRMAVWQNLFFRCLRGQRHILEDVVSTAVSLVKAGQFEELAALLAPAEFQPLRPLVLLLGWNHCYGCHNISRLMDGLWNTQALSDQAEMMQSQPVLSQACRNLAYQVQLVQWCLDKTRPLVIESGAPTTHHDRASELFQGLEFHSVLFMLHQATSLARLNQEEVLDLLHKQPSLPTEENSSKKIVRFAPVDDDSAEDISISEGPQSLQQQRDISIYRGYCAIRCFMDAILHGQDLGMKARANSSLSAGSNISGTQPSAQMEEMYCRLVTKNLEVGKDHLSQIQPLTFRAEVLENIFSLLFVTHDDLLDDRSVLSDSGGEEGQYELDRTNRGSRRESLLSCPPSLDSSVEMVSSTEVYRILADNSTMWKPNVPGTVLDAIVQASEGIAIGKEATVPENKEEVTATKEEPTTKRKKGRDKNHHPSLSDIAEPASEDRNGLSGHSSGRSGDGWTREVPRLGFLMDECLVRDILAVLKECFLNLKSARFAKLGQGQNGEDEDLLKCVSSSITESSLQQRISRLDQCINEAQWRFQLVVPEYVPKQPGLIAVGSRDSGDTSSGDEMGSYYSRWEQDKRIKRQRKKRGTSSSRSRSETATSQGTGAESEKSFAGSEQVTGTQTGTATDDSDKGRRRRRRNHSARYSSAASSLVLKRKTGIIPRMLATKGTLLNMCLQRGNYTQAHQVIKMFQFKNEANVAEVKFSENYEAAIKQLQSVEVKSKGGNTSGKVDKPAASKSPLGAIASAAAAGMASMSLNNIVDQLLKTERLPAVVWADEEEMATKPLICSLIRSENVPAMIIFDLACTATNSWEVSRSLLEMADKKVTPAVKTQELQANYKLGKEDQHRISKAEESIAGFESVFKQIVGVVGKDSGESSSLIRPEVKAKFFQHSARDVLGRGSTSLDGEELRNQVSSLLEREKAVERLFKALSEDGDMQTGEGKAGKAKRSAVQQAMQHLIKVFDGYPVLCSSLWHMEQLESLGDEDVQWADFLRSLYTHVSTMTTLLTEHQDLAKQSRASQVKPGNPFLVLTEGPTYTLGKLMFDNGVPPDHALDLRFLVLHHGLPLPSHYSLLKNRLHGLSPNDPWHEFLPPADPRVLFVLTEGAASSPPLQVLKPDEVDLQLETAIRLYLETQLAVDEAILHVKIPQLLDWYKGDFLGENQSPEDPLLALMSVLADHCPPHLADVLWKLEAQQEQQAEMGQSQLLSSAQDSAPRTDEQSPMFRISGTTQQYLRNRSHLVATLAQLICRQSEAPSPRNSTEESVDHESESEVHEDSETDINQTVQSTKIHIEDEFPVLHNFIHAMVLPLSNQLTDTFEEKRRTAGSTAIVPSLLSSHTDARLAGNVKELLLQLLQQGRLQEAVDIVENHSSALDVENAALLCDFVLCSAGTQADKEQPQSWRYLLRVRDPDLSAHMVLACLGQWPVDVCVELLEMCAGSSLRSSALEKAVEKSLQEMKVYQR